MIVVVGLAAVAAIAVACSNGEAATSADTRVDSPVETAISDRSDTAVVTAKGSAGASIVAVPPVPPAGVGMVEASAFAAQSSISDSGIWVTGQGSITLDPDLAMLNLGVETAAKTVAEARGEAGRAMDAVVAALRANGVSDNDIQTQFFNIAPQYEYQEIVENGRRGNRQVLVGYRVNNTTSVKIRDLDAVGTIIDEVATAGGDATRINGIRFTVEDSKPFTADLREAAVADALAKAQQFAGLTGVSLGRLMFISEVGTGTPVARDFAGPAFALEKASVGIPTSISGGELQISVSVQAVFGIE
jgi:uncharacterized protein YggE